MKSLKEKFGKFEMSKEQMKKVKGGQVNMKCTAGRGQVLVVGCDLEDVYNAARASGVTDLTTCTFIRP